MFYTELETSREVYKLRLTTKTTIALEKALGYNPLLMLLKIDAGEIPKVTDVIIMLHNMLQALNHGITLEKTYDIYDDYIATGKTMFDLVPLFIEVFQNSGLLAKETETESGDNEKN